MRTATAYEAPLVRARRRHAQRVCGVAAIVGLGFSALLLLRRPAFPDELVDRFVRGASLTVCAHMSTALSAWDVSTEVWTDPLRRLPLLGIASSGSFATSDDLIQAAPRLEVLSICHPEWEGVQSATYAQGHPVLEMRGIVSEAHAARLMAFIRTLPRLHTLIFNGIPPSTVHFAARLRVALPRLRILFVYHGAPSNVDHAHEAGLFSALIDAAVNGSVSRLGLVKNGVAPWLRGLGVDAHTVWNFPPHVPLLPVRRYSLLDGKRHIGLFGRGNVAKNILTQYLAACMIENTVIHVVEIPKIAYARRCGAHVIEHGFMPHPRFVEEMARMDVNMYVSLSECFPMGILESMAAGVPCLSSATSRIYAADAELQALLVVEELDNPSAIATTLRRVLEYDQTFWSWRLRYAVSWLHDKARLEWRSFLDVSASRSAEDDLSEAAQDPRLPYTVPSAAASESDILRVTHVAIAFSGAGIAETSSLCDVVSDVALQRLRHGVQVSVLSDISCPSFRQLVDKYGRSQTSRLYHELVTTDSRDAALQFSIRLIAALHRLLAHRPADIVEFVDSAAAGFATFSRRHECTSAAASGVSDAVPCDSQLLSTPLVLRSVLPWQLLQTLHTPHVIPSQHIGHMEHFCYVAADAILVSSPAHARTIVDAYGRHPRDVFSDDVESTGTLQPGSRIVVVVHTSMAADSASALQRAVVAALAGISSSQRPAVTLAVSPYVAAPVAALLSCGSLASLMSDIRCDTVDATSQLSDVAILVATPDVPFHNDFSHWLRLVPTVVSPALCDSSLRQETMFCVDPRNSSAALTALQSAWRTHRNAAVSPATPTAQRDAYSQLASHTPVRLHGTQRHLHGLLQSLLNQQAQEVRAR